VEELLAPAGVGGGLVFLPFPLFRRLEPKGGTEGSIWYSCNLTGHVTRKSRDSVRGVSESANCTWRENRGKEAWVPPGRLGRTSTVTQHLPSYAVGFSRAVKGCDKGGRILETDD